MSASMRNTLRANALLFLALFLAPTQAVFIPFEDCLDTGVQNSNPLILQWLPLFFEASFDTLQPSHNLSLTLYGNVTGQQYANITYPPPNSTIWTDPTNDFGKITNLTNNPNGGQSITAQETKVTFLDYNAWTSPVSVFCNDNFANGGCPLGPLFYANPYDPSQLHAFSISQNLNSSYAFTTLTATVMIKTGDTAASTKGCISANITPDLGSRIRALLTWLPACILIFKAISTLVAAIYSPWGSSDIFRWSSNYGRDEDLIRLVTPGFGDCLQYIQFIMLTGSLTLQYPGFYQPAVKQTAWSCLLFNESFVTHGSGTRSLVDGIYVTNGTYGMDRMSQLIGMTDIDDIWACMAIWLTVIAALVILLCQLGFFGRWVYRRLTNTTEEDLRRKNLPFTLGNLIRLMFNYFILPIVALSFFQLVCAAGSPASVVVMSAILLVIMILSAAWILRFIFRTKPRTFLFDDMPTVLLYGPFYNTYSDSAAPFALIPVFITFMRGVAIGAVQPAGVAQIVILAICEVILILTLNGLRPFQGQTSMNLYHTIFSTVRLITVLLMIAFLPWLGVTEGPKGWVGYVILILHACVLVFGFLLNAAQTLLELGCRALGVGGDAAQGPVRGSILTFRMLKKRQTRPATADRQSFMSTAAMLRTPDEFNVSRSTRSMSASSQQLLNQAGPRTPSRLSGFENFSSAGDVVSPLGDAESTTYFGAAGYRAASKQSTDLSATDNFYRPPRQRRNTADLMTPGAKSRPSISGEFPYSDSPARHDTRGLKYGGSPYPAGGRDSQGISVPYLRERADSDPDLAPRTDYAVREVDQYYRGEPLAGGPARKLRTGPADPQGPAANAQSWLQRMLFGVQNRNSKEKEKSKGFEVVRSTRAPPELMPDSDMQEDYEMVNSPPMQTEPYSDTPSTRHSEAQAVPGASQDDMTDAFDFQFPVQKDVSRDFVNESPEIRRTHPALRPSVDSQRDQHPGIRAEIPSHSRSGSGVQGGVQAYQLQHISKVPSRGPQESGGIIGLPSSNPRSSVRSSVNEANQDWLRAVDHLTWGDHSRDAAVTGEIAPQVPERSSKRPPSSHGLPSRRVSGISFPTFEGEVASPRDETLHADHELDKPTSVAVNHHRAADSITRNSFGAGQIASAAELLDTDER